MVWNAEQDIQLRPAEGTSGEIPSCVPTSAGCFIGDKMKRIPLTQGQFAVVDDENYEWLNQWKWSATKNGNTFYAARIQTKPKRKRVYMHREIMKASKGEQIDHIDKNGLNNHIINLRFCTNAQNHQNSRLRGGSSYYRGVSKCGNCNKWRADIKHKGKSIWLGNYNTEIEAAKAYNKKASELFGNFARMNDVK